MLGRAGPHPRCRPHRRRRWSPRRCPRSRPQTGRRRAPRRRLRPPPRLSPAGRFQAHRAGAESVRNRSRTRHRTRPVRRHSWEPQKRRLPRRCSPKSPPAHPPRGSSPSTANSRSRTGSQTADSPHRSYRSNARRRRHCRTHTRCPAHEVRDNLHAGQWHHPTRPPPPCHRQRPCRLRCRAAHRQRCLPRWCRRFPPPLHPLCPLASYQPSRCRLARCLERQYPPTQHSQSYRLHRPRPHRPPAQKPAALSRSPPPPATPPTNRDSTAFASAHSCTKPLLTRIGCDLPQDC